MHPDRTDTRNSEQLNARSSSDGLQVDNKPSQEFPGKCAYFAYDSNIENQEILTRRGGIGEEHVGKALKENT